MAYDLGLAERVRSLLHRRGGFSERKMFGGICFMIGGNMCCGIVKTDLMLRLELDDATKALTQPHVRPMDFSGKPMKSMVYVDAKGTDKDEDLSTWVESAYKFAKALPRKENEPPKSKAVKAKAAKH